MTRLRRVLAPLTAMLLFGHVGTVALVPVALWMSAADLHAVEECTCGHGPGALCPMHRHSKSAGGSESCVIQATNSADDAVLTVLVGFAVPLPDSKPLIAPVDATRHVRSIDVRAAGRRPVPPDPPPPRA